MSNDPTTWKVTVGSENCSVTSIGANPDTTQTGDVIICSFCPASSNQMMVNGTYNVNVLKLTDTTNAIG